MIEHYVTIVEDVLDRWVSDLHSIQPERWQRAIGDLDRAILNPDDVPVLVLSATILGTSPTKVLEALLPRLQEAIRKTNATKSH